MRLEVRSRDPRTGLKDVLIAVDRATISGPARWGGGPPATTLLETRFSLHDGDSRPVSVDAKLPWECRGRELRMR